MGQLISRAFRRLTQSASQTDALKQRESTPDRDQSSRRAPEVSVAQAIPVGQSIDSSEYPCLKQQPSEPSAKELEPVQQPEETCKLDETLNELHQDAIVATLDNNGGQPAIEEAAIKIQAFVRGHLTRKALKDAQHSLPQHHQQQQQQHSSLGQSQFDEESLTKNPPNAVFDSALVTSSVPARLSEVRLNSISESGEWCQQAEPSVSTKRPPVTLNLRSSSSPSSLEPRVDSSLGRSATPSPAPSEAASIDLGSEPMSASIDIQDYSQLAADRMAAVLHHKDASDVELGRNALGPRQVLTVPVDEEAFEPATGEDQHDNIEDKQNGDNQNQEAAAIRIQSAFRGYRTRKNSPYRSRSPQSPAGKRANADKLDFGRAIDTDDEPSSERPQVAGSGGRRPSRPRVRDSDADQEAEPAEGSVLEPENDEADEQVEPKSATDELTLELESRAPDEDKSLGLSMTTDELESEVRRLVEDLDLSTCVGDAEELDEAPVTSGVGELDELAVQTELESDDLERRDPRGEQCVLSPKIAEQLDLDRRRSSHDVGGQVADVVDVELEPAQVGLVAPPAEPQCDSGRTTPALSGSRSSSQDEDEEEEADDDHDESDLDRPQQPQASPTSHSQQRQQMQPQTGSRNKNRRNRNKKKGKK